MAFKSCQIAFLFFERVRLPHSQSLKVILEPTFIQSFVVFPHPSTISSFIFKLGPSGHEMFYQLTILGKFPRSSSTFHRVVIRSVAQVTLMPTVRGRVGPPFIVCWPAPRLPFSPSSFPPSHSLKWL